MTDAQQQQLYSLLVGPFDQQCRIARRLVTQAMQTMLDGLIRSLEAGNSAEQVQAYLPLLLSDEAHRALIDTLYLRAGTAASLQPEPPDLGAKAGRVPPLIKRDGEPPQPPGLRLRLLSLIRDLTGAARVTKLATRTRDLVTAVLSKAAEAGTATKQLVKKVRAVLLEPKRIALIAQTETLRGWNAGAEWVAEQRGKTTKRWVPVLDSATRDAHAAMAGQAPISVRSLFIVGGVPMRYPGDPAGGAKNCCNCRCMVHYL